MSFRFLLRPKWIFWTLVVVVSVVTMVNLSGWQRERLDEKKASNALVTARMDDPVAPLSDVLAPGDEALVPDAVFRRVTATGTFDETGQMLVANRSLDGLAGWWVVTPLRLDDGPTVAVVRGWVPMSVTPDGSWDEFAPVEGEVTVTGLLQASQDRVAGPTDDLRTLPRVNVPLIGERLAVDMVPAWLQLESQAPAPTGSLPRVLAPPELTEGSHLSYAVQWLLFASLTVIVYLTLLVRTAKHGDGPDGSPSEPSSPVASPIGVRASTGQEAGGLGEG